MKPHNKTISTLDDLFIDMKETPQYVEDDIIAKNDSKNKKPGSIGKNQNA